MATLNAALLIVTAMAMREGGRKAFGLCKAPAQALSLPTAVPTFSAAIVVGFNVLCSPCPCRYFACLAWPALFARVCILWLCKSRKFYATRGGGEREVEQGLFGLMTCGLNFPYLASSLPSAYYTVSYGFCPTTFVLL